MIRETETLCKGKTARKPRFSWVSCVLRLAQRNRRIHAHRPAHGNPACRQSHASQCGRQKEKRIRVVRHHAKQVTGKQTRREPCAREPCQKTKRGEPQPLSRNQSRDVRGGCA